MIVQLLYHYCFHSCIDNQGSFVVPPLRSGSKGDRHLLNVHLICDIYEKNSFHEWISIKKNISFLHVE